MKFQVECIFTIEEKKHLIVKSLSPGSNFKLSDTCYLGEFQIENWFTIPKAPDELGNQRSDIFVFALKDVSVVNDIRQWDTLELNDHFVTVIESAYTVSGGVLAILECGTGMLSTDSILSSENGKKWRIIKNDLLIGRKSDIQLQKKAEKSFWFLYRLQPVNHTSKPDYGPKLRVEPPPNSDLMTP